MINTIQIRDQKLKNTPKKKQKKKKQKKKEKKRRETSQVGQATMWKYYWLAIT